MIVPESNLWFLNWISYEICRWHHLGLALMMDKAAFCQSNQWTDLHLIKSWRYSSFRVFEKCFGLFLLTGVPVKFVFSLHCCLPTLPFVPNVRALGYRKSWVPKYAEWLRTINRVSLWLLTVLTVDQTPIVSCFVLLVFHIWIFSACYSYLRTEVSRVRKSSKSGDQIVCLNSRWAKIKSGAPLQARVLHKREQKEKDRGDKTAMQRWIVW